MNLGKIISSHILFVLLFIVGSVQKSHAYSAYPLNPELAGLCQGGSCQGAGGFPVANMPVYTSMLKAYLIALSAPLLSPANTIGINGFEFDFAYTFTTPADSEWQYATERRSAERWERDTSGNVTEKSVDSSLNTLFFTLRKGLPYSFEVEAQLGYLVKTEISSIGGAFKWSLNEAVKKLPVDFATRLNILHSINPKHLDFSTIGLDFVLGKPFGLVGMLNLAPYIAYRPLWIIPHSVTVDSVPNTNPDDDSMMNSGAANTMGNTTIGPIVFPSKAEEKNFPIMLNRVTLGARFLIGVFKLTPEFTMAPDDSGTHVSFSVSLGLNL
jgi:hypothetical protein